MQVKTEVAALAAAPHVADAARTDQVHTEAAEIRAESVPPASTRPLDASDAPGAQKGKEEGIVGMEEAGKDANLASSDAAGHEPPSGNGGAAKARSTKKAERCAGSLALQAPGVACATAGLTSRLFLL